MTLGSSRGIALISVLWITGLLAVIAASFASSTRTEARLARNLVANAKAEALASGRPVVALESTIISHGLPRPDNLAAARRFEQLLVDAGVVPATIALLDGQLAGRACVGEREVQLEPEACPGRRQATRLELLAAFGHMVASGSRAVGSTIAAGGASAAGFGGHASRRAGASCRQAARIVFPPGAPVRA